MSVWALPAAGGIAVHGTVGIVFLDGIEHGVQQMPWAPRAGSPHRRGRVQSTAGWCAIPTYRSPRASSSSVWARRSSRVPTRFARDPAEVVVIVALAGGRAR